MDLESNGIAVGHTFFQPPLFLPQTFTRHHVNCCEVRDDCHLALLLNFCVTWKRMWQCLLAAQHAECRHRAMSWLLEHRGGSSQESGRQLAFQQKRERVLCVEVSK